MNINLRGTTAGIYIDASTVHGFIRSPSNQFTSVDPTGSIFTRVCEETCLNPDGTVAGFYTDSSGITHGFVRHANGTIASIDAPAPAGLTTIATEVASINVKGEIAGLSLDSNFVFHGFVRHPDGSFTTFDDPEAGTGTIQGTGPFSINLGGATTGQYIDASNNAHGFERFPDGQFANFDAPDAAPSSRMTFGLFGTRPSTNNAEGEVAGWYMDAGGLNHGFFWIPGTPDGYAVSTLTPGQSEAVSSATVPDPPLAISRLPLPEKIRELILRRALIGGLGAPGSQPQ